MFKLIKFLSTYKLQVIFVFVLMFLQSLSQLYLPTLMADIVDIGVLNGDIDYILVVGAVMLLIAAAGTLCTVWANYLSSKIGIGFSRILRHRVFSRVESFSLHEFDRIGTASLITRTTNDITQIQQVMIMTLRIVISAPMMIIGGIIMAYYKNPELSMVIVIVVPIIAASILIVIRKVLPLFKMLQVKLDKLNLILREGLTGTRVIRAFNRIDHEKNRFNTANNDLTSTTIKVNKIMAGLMPVMMLVLNFTIIAVIWFGSISIDNENMLVGDLMAFIQYIMLIMFSLLMVSMIFMMMPRASASALRIHELLDTIPEINDPAQQVKASKTPEGIVEFRNVTFSYPGAEKPALENISFSAGPGKVTAIIGGTGSGKSTLVNLIPRFYDVDSGGVFIDGVDVRNMSQQGLRGKMGLVPQKAVLFTGTIAENIKFGKADANDEEILHAAEIAQATEFISGLTEGFKSDIAQGGNNISGGQKQRLSIARALVRRPEIYIFDDAFSALDYKTDARLRAALKTETSSSTVLMVSQRVSTVINADQIIVLNNGQVTGIGKHDELLITCEVYREIVSSQLSEDELA